jgi:hypothetical protein
MMFPLLHQCLPKTTTENNHGGNNEDVIISMPTTVHPLNKQHINEFEPAFSSTCAH